MKEILGLIAVALVFIAFLPYIFDILRNKTKPHVFTWSVWSLVTLLAFVGQWQKGGGAGSWTTAAAGSITIVIAFLAVNKGTKDITRFDVVIFIGALLAIIPWLLTKDPTISVLLLTVIDASGYIPTMRKTINDPTSETLSSYSINACRHILSIFALTHYNLATYSYPSVLAVMNIILVYVIVKFRHRILTQKFLGVNSENLTTEDNTSRVSVERIKHL